MVSNFSCLGTSRVQATSFFVLLIRHSPTSQRDVFKNVISSPHTDRTPSQFELPERPSHRSMRRPSTGKYFVFSSCVLRSMWSSSRTNWEGI